jgi:hypothetical protein
MPLDSKGNGPTADEKKRMGAAHSLHRQQQSSH